MAGINEAIRRTIAGGGIGTKNYDDIINAHEKIYTNTEYKNENDKWEAWVEFIIEKA